MFQEFKAYMLYLFEKAKGILTFKDLRATSGALVAVTNAFIILFLTFYYVFNAFSLFLALIYIVVLLALYAVCVSVIAFLREQNKYEYAIGANVVFLATFIVFILFA